MKGTALILIILPGKKCQKTARQAFRSLNPGRELCFLS